MNATYVCQRLKRVGKVAVVRVATELLDAKGGVVGVQESRVLWVGKVGEKGKGRHNGVKRNTNMQ